MGKRRNFGFFGVVSVVFVGLIFPSIVRADMMVGFFWGFPVFFGILAFLGVWIIEAILINKSFEENHRRGFLVAFLINFVSSSVGVLSIIIYSTNFWFLKSEGIFILFLMTTLIEGVVLWFFYKEKKISEILKIDLKINILSYIFLIVFAFSDFFVFPSIILAFLVIYYFIDRGLLDFLKTRKENDNIGGGGEHRYRKLLKIFCFIGAVIILFIFATFLAKQSKDEPLRRQDARVVSDLRQIQNGLELYFSKCEYYPGFKETMGTCLGFDGQPINASELGRILKGSDIGIAYFPERNFDYVLSEDGKHYVLRATLNFQRKSSINKPDFMELDCSDNLKHYCVSI